MFNKKKIILVGIILIIVVGVLVVMFFSLNKEKDKNDPEREIKTEAQEIINANKEAINNAENKTAGGIEPINKTDHTLGQIDAPIQFIVYSDFECPFCAQFAKTVEKVREEFGGKVVVAFRHFPLTASHHNAMTAAIASECADEQGKFWEMRDKLFAANVDKKFNVNQFKKDAVDIGLDASKFNECLDKEKYRKKVETQLLAGKNAGILGAPQSYINGQPLPGAYPFEDFTDSGGFERTGMKNIIIKNLE